MKLPQILTKLRGKTSRAVFAEKLGISEGTLRNYEKGLSLPNFDVGMRICKILMIEPHQLLGSEAPTYGGALEARTGISPDMVAAVIEIVEDILDSTKRKLAPKKKAELVVTICELYSDSAEKLDTATVLRLVKLVA